MIQKKCECGHSRSRHASTGSRVCWEAMYRKICACLGYKPKRLRRVRVAKPIARKSQQKRTKRPRKQRKASLGAARRTLWDYFSTYVKERDGKTCITCPNPEAPEGEQIQAGHMFTAGHHSAVYYDPMNVHSQCSTCNCGHRGRNALYVERFIERYGIDQFRELAHRATAIKKWTMPEVRELIEALKRGGAEFEMFWAERYVVASLRAELARVTE